MLEEEKERGKAIAKMPLAERNKLVARMMFGEAAPQAQMVLFMLMGAWGVAPPGPPGGPPGGAHGAGGSPGGPPPQH
ncbi:MAG: hypothetical protein ACUVR2_10875 [Anaerolineae bacterium]